ncbi:27786_t:CDS:1, partial [Racocetra persica]
NSKPRLDTTKKPVTALTLAKRPGTGSTHLQRASKNPKAYCDTLIQASINLYMGA